MSITEELNKAIAAHGMWKGTLQEAIETGKSAWTVEAAATESACDFGRWFDSLPEFERTSARGRRIRELHAGFHREAASVLALALNGARQEALRAIGPQSEFGALSAKLTITLMEWRKAAG